MDELGQYVDYRAELNDKNFLIADVDSDGSDEAVVFITEYEPKSRIYPLYIQVLENNNGKWICSGAQSTILLGGSELSIYSIELNNGMIIVNRNAHFDRYNMTSKDIEEIYKFDKGILIKIQEKTIKVNEPLG